MSERATSSAIRDRFASIPSTQNSRKRAQASVRRSTECRKLKMMTGLKTFSSKLPCEPAMAIAVSLPITWTATIDRLGLRGIDLARHDRGARLVLGKRELTEAAPRTRAEPAEVVGDLHEGAGQRAQHAARHDEVVVGRERGELVGGRGERQTR